MGLPLKDFLENMLLFVIFREMVPADEVGEILTIFRAQTAAYLSEASLEGGSKVPVGAAAAAGGTHPKPAIANSLK